MPYLSRNSVLCFLVGQRAFFPKCIMHVKLIYCNWCQISQFYRGVHSPGDARPTYLYLYRRTRQLSIDGDEWPLDSIHWYASRTITVGHVEGTVIASSWHWPKPFHSEDIVTCLWLRRPFTFSDTFMTYTKCRQNKQIRKQQTNKNRNKTKTKTKRNKNKHGTNNGDCDRANFIKIRESCWLWNNMRLVPTITVIYVIYANCVNV